MLFSTIACVLLAANEAPASPPATPPIALSEAGVTQAPANEPPEVKAFAHFLERHQISTDFLAANQFGGPLFRQEGRSYTLLAEDVSLPFSLVPEAADLIASAQRTFRAGVILNAIALGSLAGSVLMPLPVSLLAAGSSALTTGPIVLLGLMSGLLVVGLVCSIVGMVLMTEGIRGAQNAVATYNRGLLDLRPVAEHAVGLPPAGGLTFALPDLR